MISNLIIVGCCITFINAASVNSKSSLQDIDSRLSGNGFGVPDNTFNGSAYLIDWGAVLINAYEAHSVCEANNWGKPVSIETSEENDFLNNYLTQMYIGSADADTTFWTSGVRIDGDWFWKSTGEKFEFTNWEEAHPIDGSAKSCVKLQYTDSGLIWVNTECNEYNNVICETTIVTSIGGHI